MDSMKRRRILKATGTATLAGLAGCTGGPGEETETTEPPAEESPGGGMGTDTPGEGSGGMYDASGSIHILTDYSSTAWQRIWDGELIPDFQARTGATPRIEYVGFAGVGEQRLTTLLQAGNPPEAFTGGPDQIGDMLARGQLGTTNDAVEQLVSESDIGELISSPLTLEGNWYNFPHGKYFSTFLYRSDVIESLGLPEPTTMERILDNARAIDESDEFAARGFGLAGQRAGKSSRDFEVFLSALGGWYWQWKTNDREEPEVWFPQDEVVRTLEYMDELSQYSPDPSSISWGESLSYWAGNRIAQEINLNAWAAGVAANAGNLEIARNTEMIALPTSEGAEQYAPLVSTDFDGQMPIALADNLDGLFAFLRWMYRDPEQAAKYYVSEPTRFIPAYSNVLQADAYQNAEVFQQVPHLLEMNRKSASEFGPLDEVADEDRLVFTPASIYAGRFPIVNEMVNQVVITGRDPEAAWEEARGRLETRLAEGKEIVEENF